MTTSHQPGSPGAVDLDELADAACKRALPLSWEAETEADERGNGGECIYNAFDVCSSFRDGYKARAAEEESELRTLRARVGELEEDHRGDLDHIGKLQIESAEGWGKYRAEKVERRAADARAESAEARVRELEASIARIHSFAGRGDGHGSLAATEACLADTFTMLRIDYDNAAKEAEADAARITDLESQLAELHRATEESSFLDLKDRLTTVIDEAFGMQPSMTGDELVSFLEQRLFRDRQAHNELESQLAAAREGKASVWEERNRELVRELEETRAFLRRTAMAGGSIVSSASMTSKQIAIARAADRMIVMPDGYGFVYVPCAQSAKDEG